MNKMSMEIDNRKKQDNKSDILEEVTVVCEVYNKEHSIYNTLETLVDQTTNFKYILYVCDNFSSDNTKNIIKEFAEKYPDIVIPFYRTKHMDRQKSFVNLCEKVKSNYITFCDDEAYWVEKNKLQNQYDALTEDTSIIGVVGKAIINGNDEDFENNRFTKCDDGNFYFPTSLPNCYIPNGNSINTNHIIENNIVNLSTTMLRTSLFSNKNLNFLKKYASCFSDITIPFLVLNIGNQNLKYIDEVLATISVKTEYKNHSEKLKFIDTLHCLKEYNMKFCDSYASVSFDNRIRRELYICIKQLKKNNNSEEINALREKYPDITEVLLNAIENNILIEEKYEPVMVTVVCVTYNHENYIRQTLDSFLMQKTNFKFQVYIGEDCGLDSTRDIVKEYAEKCPDTIIPFLRPKNVGSIRNFGDLCERVYSDYIAFCDGDDYWIDELKLQNQFDFLEENQKFKGVSGRLKLDVPNDWYLANYYKKNKDGHFYQPDFLPDFTMPKNRVVNINHMVMDNITHGTATMIKINHKIQNLPEWFYKTYIGDTPYVMLQIGRGCMKFTDDVVGIYRKHEMGATSTPDMDTNMYNTRLSYITYLSGIREYFIAEYGSFGVVTIENRIKQEVANYLRVLIKLKDDKKIQELFQQHPMACRIAMSAYLSFYSDSRKMTRIYGWEGNKLVSRSSKFMHLAKPFVKSFTKMKAIKHKTSKRILKLCGLGMYLLCSLVPKNKKLWVFTSFRQKGYLDNSKYYYEYVRDNHPEIKPVWLTKDENVLEMLKTNGDKVYKSTSARGIWTMARAKIAVTDHFRMTDYPSILGYNYGTKVVQLWHGVGLKSMGDGKKVKNTDILGVQYSSDLLPTHSDNWKKRFSKKLKYLRKAFYREMFEEYFLFACPGQERIDMIGKIWNIPEENYFMAGHPRNLPMYKEVETSKNLIIYAPTYRAKSQLELETIELLLEDIPLIQKTMEKIDAKFIIRLHPHTWRNYKTKILSKIIKYNRILFDDVKDVYPDIAKYSIMISDYSSIAFDFAFLNKPVVYLCHDYDRFINQDAGFNLDYFKHTPGPKTYSWTETLKEIKKYIKNPKKDSDLRKRVCEYFFDESANSIYDSKNITLEIKRRLKI